MKVITDMKVYLDEIEKLSKRLDTKQRTQLSNVLSSVLTLLVSLKKASNLGSVSIRFPMR